LAVRRGGIPENIIEEVIAKNDIVSVVGQYVKFSKTSGANMFGLCPFHSEDTPSFSVSKTKQIYYCFGCHKGGNVLHFIMEVEKCSFLDAVKLLAEKSGIAIPEPEDDGYKEKAQVRDRVREALLEAARYFYRHLTLPEGKKAVSYLQKRNLTPATAKAFGLGYAPEDWTGLYKHLKNKGFSNEILSQSGLFTKRDNGELLDLFRGRLMFPIFDVMGKIIAFGGRILDDGNPKYINSPESVVYSKQRNLYALNFAKTTKEKKIIVAEGYMDVISMHQAGFTNAVAPLGTALTELQLNLISRYTEEIVFFFDSDRAGQQAALRSLQMLLEKNKRRTNASVKISIARVPDGKDPDDYIRTHGAVEFKKLIAEAYSVLEYLLYSAKMQATQDGKLELRTYKELSCKYLSWESDAVLRESAAHEAASVMGVSVASVLSEVEKTKSGQAAEQKMADKRELDRREFEISNQENPENGRAEKDELMIVCLLTQIGTKYKTIKEKPSASEFSKGTMRELVTDILSYLENNSFDAGVLMELCEDRVINGRAAREVFSEALMLLANITGEQRIFAETRMWILRRKETVYGKRRKAYFIQRAESDDENERKRLEELFNQMAEKLKDIQKELKDLSYE